MTPPGEITRLIVDWQNGNRDAENALYDALYKRLHGIAVHHLRNEGPGQSLGATALVHEAYLRFRRSERLDVADSSHFLRLVARVMRQILVDRARARRAAKRQGEVPDSYDIEAIVSRDAEAEEIISVDRALDKLTRSSPRLAQLVELRYFAEFSEKEAAAIMGVSARTVRRDWTVAKTRLRADIDGNRAVAL